MKRKNSLTQRFSYGRKLVREVLDPHGQALTTRHGYVEEFEDFDPNDNPSGYAQLAPQWIERPDGGWEWYGYDKNSRRNRVVRPVGNVPRPQKLPEPGPGYDVTLTEFDPDASTEIIKVIVEGVIQKTTTKTWAIEGEILREETRVSYGDKPGFEVDDHSQRCGDQTCDSS